MDPSSRSAAEASVPDIDPAQTIVWTEEQDATGVAVSARVRHVKSIRARLTLPSHRLALTPDTGFAEHC
jgi:hypothetical protein